MTDDLIQILTEMQIKEHFKQDKNKYIITKEDLIKFSTKLIKTIDKYK